MARWVLLTCVVVGLAGNVRAQDFGANDGASPAADSFGRANDGALDRSADGVGAAADHEAQDVDGAFDEDTDAVNRTFNESADPSAGIGSPEGTLQESSAIVNGILE